ncbi:MAG TPA: CotH kinase family protein [Bacteroidales bacterium]
MKKLLLVIFLVTFNASGLFSQNPLFDNSRVSSVYIEIPPDSLAVIMTDVLSDHYFLAKFIYDYGTGRDTLQDIGFRLRGNTSRFSQKKSFKISFNEYVSGRKYQGVKKINLNGQHNDPTMIREKLFYDTWNRCGMAERRTSFVQVYINQLYYGLYTNLEELDKDWLDRVYGEKSGNLYKCTYPADLVYKGASQQLYKDIVSGSSTGGRAYDLQTNNTEDDYTDLVQLISELDQPADALFEAQISQLIDVDEFLKAFALDVASGNWDDYMYNKNNYYLYHRMDIGKFEFISYDTDNTFGVDWLDRDWATRNCLDWFAHSDARPLAVKLLAIPAFQDRYQRYLDTIARTIILPDSIFPHIDAMKALITAAATNDTYRTLDYGYTMTDFNNGFTQTVDGHTPYGIKPFLTTRYTTILQQLAAADVPENKSGDFSLLIFPNPASEQITLSGKPSRKDRHGWIVDVLGRHVQAIEWSKNQGSLTIPVTSLLSGIYTVIFNNDGRLHSSRFIKK